jgi:superfamily II DNA or RNA helicase
MAEEKKYDMIVQFGVGDASHASVRVYSDRPGFNPSTVHTFLNSAFTYFSESKKRSWEVKHHINGAKPYEEFYDLSHGWIPTGMVARARDYLKMQYGDRVGISITNEIRQMYSPPDGPIPLEDIKAYAESLNIWNRGEYEKALAKGGKVSKEAFRLTPYEHQYRLVELALNKRRCCLFACTSAGKSVSIMIIARYLVEKEHRKVLVIVPSKGLVEQLYDNFYQDYGWDEAREHCTLLHGESSDRISKKKLEELRKASIGEESLLKDITISTWQTLQHKHKGFFKVFDAVLVDEAHGMKGKVLRAELEWCVNANGFKVGVSGTLPLVKPSKDNRARNGEIGITFAPDDMTDSADFIDACNIESQLGPVYDVVHLRELIAKGLLTPVKVNFLYVPYPPKTRYSLCYSKYPDERALVLGNSSRKDVISMLIDSGNALKQTENTVILYDGLDRLHDLHDYLSKRFPQYHYHVIEGEINAAEREEIRHMLEDSVGNILIATYGCMKQGVNIKLLHNLVLAEPAKSMYKVMQSVGRIVRKHPNKTLAQVFDIVDDANCWTRKRDGSGMEQKFNYMLKHSRFRMTYYDAEDIPMEEFHLDGIYEATLTPEDIKKHRQEAAEKAERLNKAREMAQTNLPYVRKFTRE